MEIYLPGKKHAVMTAKEVRDFDAYAINELGIPGVVLMENAGRGCAELVIEKLAGIEKAKAVIVCGTGNNGGDGYVIARHLFNENIKVAVVICGEAEKIKGDAAINLQILKNIGQAIETINPGDEDSQEKIKKLIADCDIVVDAIFGTGLNGPLRDDYKPLIDAVNAQGKKILSVDIPSGLNCDSGQPQGTAIKADYTVTFVAVKKGFTNPASRRYTGQIYIASIGIEPLNQISKL